MNLRKIFFAGSVPLRASDILPILREGLVGVLLAVGIAVVALLVGDAIKVIDPLVLAVILGMLVRATLGRQERFLVRTLPGIFLAQTVFIPVGIILYGKNLDFHVLAKTNPLVAIETLGLSLVSMLLLYALGRLIGLRGRFGLLLGFGSAVCGASAIAITSPICECEPDETAVGLVANTRVVLMAVAGFDFFVRSAIPSETYATMCGELLHQTGAVKMALQDLSADLQVLGMTLKSLRVAFLLVLIPVVSRLLRRGLYFPWYLLLFAAVGVLFSTVRMPAVALQLIGGVHNLCFASALASVGLNARIGSVLVRLPKPLLLVSGVFVAVCGLFLAMRTL